MRLFHLQIATPDGLVFDGEAESLLVRCELGDVEILAGHTDYFAALGIGRARIRLKDGSRTASCIGGFLSVERGEVRLAATTFEYAEDIDKKRAETARERAEAQLAAAKDERAMNAAKARLARALNRIRVSELK